ncbi:MAG: diguanylate cyclase, partial [Burkholderiales bacterium]|nr:diguanylate cyclase [Anaerolineae bacterium]
MSCDRTAHQATVPMGYADRLRSSVRATDIVARFGGDEFAVLRRGAAAAAEIGDLAKLLMDRITA